MAEPKRIQLRRTKGWRKPEGAIVVARPSKWGNPYRIEKRDGTHPWVVMSSWRDHILGAHETKAEAAEHSVEVYEIQVGYAVDAREVDISPLTGHDLMCWCPLDQPCHADVLLEIANGGAA
jgi:hypothetical protein